MVRDREERQLGEEIERDEWKPMKNSSVLSKKLKAAAKATMLKDQRMNIRIAKRDLESLKARALEEGMPYQSLVSSVLHKYITGRLVESHK